MEKKMLMLATTAAMIEQFNKNNILILEEMGYEIHVIGNWKVGNPISDERLEQFKLWLEEHHSKWFHMDSTRKPSDLKNNISAYKKVVNLIKEYKYDFIHCHTPIGSVIARFASHKTKTPVIYTAHGFHFYEGAPLINWILYYPVEKLLSYWTDILVLINQEDYNRAKKKFHAKYMEHLPGVGIDVERYIRSTESMESLRVSLGYQKNDFLIVSVGELNKNKNHELILRAIAEIKNSSIKYIICGKGELDTYLTELAKELGISQQLYLTGYTSNVKDFLSVADIFAFPSKREGLGLAALEAMASGLPLIASYIHGIKDYLLDGITGCAIKPDSIISAVNAITRMYIDEEFRMACAKNNVDFVRNFDVKKSNSIMKQLYLKLEKEKAWTR